MRRSACMLFFKNYIREISRGQGDREHVNPADQFAQNVAAGMHDGLFSEDYSARRDETEELSVFWEKKPFGKTLDIFGRAIEEIDLDDESIQKIAEILTDCYSSTIEKRVQISFEEADDSDEFDINGTVFDDMQETLEEPAPEEKQPENSQKDDSVYNSPKEIHEWLSKHVYGQEEAVKAAAMLLYNHKKGRKRNVLFVGPTGCGKTEIWRACSQIYPYIRIVDGTTITGEGWSGSFKIGNIFDGMNWLEAEKSIIVIDEFDKLCEPHIGSHGTNYSTIVQNELLKIIEGAEVKVDGHFIDTSKVSFVFCGSFEQLTENKTEQETGQTIGFGASLERREAQHVYKETLKPDDLVRHAGVRQEIVGRINQIVRLSPMTAETYLEILKDELMSPLHKLERQYGVKLQLDETTREKLVEEAEATRMGVRYLRSRIQELLDEQMFWNCNQEEYKLSA